MTLAGLLETLAVVAGSGSVVGVVVAGIAGFSSSHGPAKQSVQPSQHVRQGHHVNYGRLGPPEVG